MTVYGTALAERFARKHPDARKPLSRLLDVFTHAKWRHLADLKADFASADYTASGVTLFNLGGNKYRLATVIDFNKQELFIDSVMTHEQYDRETF
ncbi:MAG: type II toxin-antitoxin system HigB family toxin [Acidobacteria bacterium]|nr:type II toxin-antitoxin system HigB family toxin [Acidobacteriota bacterium]